MTFNQAFHTGAAHGAYLLGLVVMVVVTICVLAVFTLALYGIARAMEEKPDDDVGIDCRDDGDDDDPVRLHGRELWTLTVEGSDDDGGEVNSGDE